MPTFEIGLDDGRKLHIDADNHEAALAGVQHFLGNDAPAEKGGMLDAAKQGVADLAKGFGNTADVLGASGVGKALNDAGDAVNPTAKADTTLYDDKGFHAENIGNAIAANSPSVAAALTAARLAPGGLIGKLVAAGLVGGASAFGNNAKDAAFKRTGDANAPTNASDLASSALRTLPEAAISSLPIGRIAGAPLAKLGMKGVVGSLGRTAVDAAGMGAANAGSNVYDQALMNGSVDPTQAINAGAQGAFTGLAAGAGRTVNDAKAAIKYRGLAGIDPEHYTEAATRLRDAVANNDGSLRNTGDGYDGMKSAMTDVGTELKSAASSLSSKDLPPEAQNVLARAKAGLAISSDDAATLKSATDDASGVDNLQRLSGVARSLKVFADTGYMNDKSGTFKGGISGTIEDHIRGFANPTGALAGTAIAATTGSHILAYSPHALAALGGAYTLARIADFASGNRSPVKGIVDRFADQTRGITPGQIGTGAGAEQLHQQADDITGRPGPTGPSIGLNQPWGSPPPQPQAAPQAPPTPPLNLSPVAMAMLKRQYANPPQAPAPPAPPAPQAPEPPWAPSKVAMTMLKRQFANPPQAPSPEAPQAPQAPEMPQFSEQALNMLRAKLKAGQPITSPQGQLSPPVPLSAPVAPAPAAPAFMGDVPSTHQGRGSAPEAPAVPAKITKTEKSGVKETAPKPPAQVSAPEEDLSIPEFLRRSAPTAAPVEAPQALAKQALSKLNGAPTYNPVPDDVRVSPEVLKRTPEEHADFVTKSQDADHVRKETPYWQKVRDATAWKQNVADKLGKMFPEKGRDWFLNELIPTNQRADVRALRDHFAHFNPEVRNILSNERLDYFWPKAVGKHRGT